MKKKQGQELKQEQTHLQEQELEQTHQQRQKQKRRRNQTHLQEQEEEHAVELRCSARFHQQWPWSWDKSSVISAKNSNVL